jgi:hypothetical protein
LPGPLGLALLARVEEGGEHLRGVFVLFIEPFGLFGLHTCHDASKLALSGSGEKVSQEGLDAGGYFVADGADGVEGEAGRVREVPVLVALAGVDGAGVATAHGDDDTGGLDLSSGQRFGELARDVEADLGHGGDHGGVEFAGGLGACGGDEDAAGGVVAEECGGHLGPAGVVGADEQDFGDVGHW